MDDQRRGRRLAMSTEEREAFLLGERTCRVGSLGHDGAPHVTALWFVWCDESIWLTSLVQSQRWADIQRDPRVSILIDSGAEFLDLKGVEIRGLAAPVGEVPRTGEPVPALERPEALFAQKYAGGSMRHDGRHAWLQIKPKSIVSWDFTKIAGSTPRSSP
jgi:Pyridoxamine 5'-phosphate oxidase